MDRVISFAETQVAPRRIVMGLGFYGRDWQGSRTTDLLWDDATAIRANLQPHETRTPSGELYLAYTKDGAAHQAFFPDGLAIRAKLRMMISRHPHIRGVYAWEMGQEDPRVWPELRRALH